MRVGKGYKEAAAAGWIGILLSLKREQGIIGVVMRDSRDVYYELGYGNISTLVKMGTVRWEEGWQRFGLIREENFENRMYGIVSQK